MAQNNNLMTSVEESLTDNNRLLSDCRKKIETVQARLHLLELIACYENEEKIELTPEEEILVNNNQRFFNTTLAYIRDYTIENRNAYLMAEKDKLMVEKDKLMDKEKQLMVKHPYAAVLGIGSTGSNGFGPYFSHSSEKLSSLTIIDVITRAVAWEEKQAEVSSRNTSRISLSGPNGIDFNDSLLLNRSSTVLKALDILSRFSCLFLKASPATGKTALAQLIARSLMMSGDSNDVRVYHVQFVGWKCFGLKPHEYILKKTEQNVNVFNCTFSGLAPTLLILDDIQELYDNDEEFCRFLLKNFLSCTFSNLKVICLATYSGNLSIAFSSPVGSYASQTLFSLDLLLSNSEQDDFLKKCDTYLATKNNVLSDISVLQYIKSSCGGSIGALRGVAEGIHKQFKLSGDAPSCLVQLDSPGFFVDVLSRLLPVKISDLGLSDSQKGIIITLLTTVDYFKWGFLRDHEKDIIFLEKAGVVAPFGLQPQPVIYDFVIPLYRRLFFQKIFPSNADITWETSQIKEFLLFVLEKFNSNRFVSGSHASASSGFPKEATFQHEFYACAASSLNPNIVVVPEMSKIFDSKGEIDFYINSTLCWGFQLLIQGNTLPGHVQRFENPKGVYYTRPRNMKYLIVDFRNKRVNNKDFSAGYVSVVFSEDFTTAMVTFHDDNDCREIHLKK